jgi:dTDP-4-amino-4,6-dideoxygalactose transaminase
MRYPLTIPHILRSDIDAVTSVLESGMLVQGKEVLKLESSVEKIIRTKSAIAVSNGTATMHLVLQSLGIGKGDEVIVPAFSYIATANVVELVGATPVFVDIEIETFNIDVKKIRTAITNNTKAIIPVHEFGLASNISEIIEIANLFDIYVIEDAACAFGATENGIPVGSFGIAGSFSFHPRKSFTSGEGGIITTNNEVLEFKLRALRNHGINPDNLQELEFVLPGYNYRLTDFQAALLNSQLKRFNEVIKIKQELAEVYLNELDSSIMKLPSIPENKNHTWQTFHIILDSINRNQLIEELKKEGIGTNYGAQCIPSTKYYFEKYGLNSKEIFSNAYNSYYNGLALPLYIGLTKEDVQIISKKVNNKIKHVK